MTGDEIDVHVNVNDTPISLERLNRLLNNVPVELVELDTFESAEPGQPTTFTVTGIGHKRSVDEDKGIAPELYFVGRAIRALQDSTNLVVQETCMNCREPEYNFDLEGEIQP